MIDGKCHCACAKGYRGDDCESRFLLLGLFTEQMRKPFQESVSGKKRFYSPMSQIESEPGATHVRFLALVFRQSNKHASLVVFVHKPLGLGRIALEPNFNRFRLYNKTIFAMNTVSEIQYSREICKDNSPFFYGKVQREEFSRPSFLHCPSKPARSTLQHRQRSTEFYGQKFLVELFRRQKFFIFLTNFTVV